MAEDDEDGGWATPLVDDPDAPRGGRAEEDELVGGLGAV